MSVLEHAKEVCHQTFPGHVGDISILYMCQASKVNRMYIENWLHYGIFMLREKHSWLVSIYHIEIMDPFSA